MKYIFPLFAILVFASCATQNKADQNKIMQSRVQAFLESYNNEYQRLYTISSEAQWKTNTYIMKGDSLTGKANDDAAKAMAEFTGSQAVIDSVQTYLKLKDALTEIQIKQLNAILYAAANNPQSMKEMVDERIKAETEQIKNLFGFNFTIDNQCEIIGDKRYINPQLFLTETKNPFVQEKRDYPIYFGYPTQEKFNINIEIPKGYAVESIPKAIKLQTRENVTSFTFNAEISNNNIQIVIVKESNKQLVSSGFYPVLKDFYKQMIDKLNEKIVLKKI